MTEINDLSTTAASNNLAAPDGYPENTMIINELNDSGREDLARLARWYGDHRGSITTAGTLTAYTYASARTIPSYYDGLDIVADFHVASGAAPTLNVDAVGAVALIWPDGTALAANDIPANAKVMLRYDGVSFQVMSAVLSPGSKQDDVITTRGDIVRGSTGGGPERLAVGATTTVLTSDGTDPSWQAFAGVSASDTVAGNIEIAVQSEMEAATSNVLAVTPGRQHFHPGTAKFWCLFDGSQVGPITPSVDFNVVDVTDNGTGDYTVNIDTDFSGVSWSPYIVARQSSDNAAGSVSPSISHAGSLAAGTIRVKIASGNTLSYFNSTRISVGGFGDQ